MKRALFVSDIHIASEDDPKCALFMRVLEACRERGIQDLFLVGDIFDLWIADRPYFVDRYPHLIAKLREVVAAGTRVHYFEGNHDLDLRPFWQHKLGVTVHSEAAFFAVAGLRLRVEHGDQMDPEDRGYLFLRWLLRTPLLVALGRYLPNWLVAQIGKRASHGSRLYTTQVKTASDAAARAKIHAHAQRVHGVRPFDLFVSGHVHTREDSQHGEFRCIGLGTWLKEPVVFDLSEKSGELKTAEAFIREPPHET